MQTRITRLIILAFSLQAFSLFPALPAQQVRQPGPADATPASGAAAPTPNRKLETVNSPAATPAGSSAADDEIVELSKFVVTDENDDGYAAMSTTSGSRISTPLRDTSASISAFTEEFLNDIGAQSLEDILSYAGNVTMDYGDASYEFESPETRFAGSSNSNFRMRELSATVLLDGVTTSIPIDQYNISNTELAYGANAILFGIGSQGGVVAHTSKRANVRRNLLSLKNTIGFWSSSPTNGIGNNRTTLDYNLVLVRRKMAFRLNGLYVNNRNWRHWEFTDDRRITPAFTAKPFKNTTLYIAYEGGRKQNATTRNFNFENRYTVWNNAGAAADKYGPVMEGWGTGYQVAGTRQISPSINNYVYVNNDNTIINTRQSYESWQTGDNVYLLDSSISPWAYSTVGPGGTRDQKFNRWFVNIEQKIGNLDLELSYIHDQNSAVAYAPDDNRGALQGDPNKYIAAAIWVSNPTTVNLIENPHAGELYTEDLWMKDTNWRENDTYRLTANYELDLKKLGRHRFIGFLEHRISELLQKRYDECLIDEEQRPINNTNPNHTSNRVRRRQYITEGDFPTYYQGNPNPPIAGMLNSEMNRYFRSAWVMKQRAATHVESKMTSALIALQSYWLRNRLVTIAGFRMDDVSFDMQWPLTPISSPSDPRYYMVLNKTKALGEYDFHPDFWRSGNYKPRTLSLGAIYHLTKRLSPMIGYSTNRGLPELDGRLTIHKDSSAQYYGDIPPLTEGKTLDYGVKFDLFGNGRLTGRIVRYDTRMVGDTFTPNSVDTDYSNALGSTNLWNIYDALYFLRTTNYTGTPRDPTDNNRNHALVTYPDGREQRVNTVDHQGPLNDPDLRGDLRYDVTPASSAHPYGAPPQYNAGMIDLYSKGFEFEVTGKITDNLSIRAVVTYADRNRTNIANEIFQFYNENISKWMTMADPAKNGGIQYWVNVTNLDGAPTAPTALIPNVRVEGASTYVRLDDFIWNQLYGLTNATTIDAGSSLRGGLASQMANQTGQNALRPWKGVVTLTYKFPNTSRLKGLKASFSCRYQSPNRMPSPNRAVLSYLNPPRDLETFDLDPQFYYDNASTINGNSILQYDCMVGYKMKVGKGRTSLTFQLNVVNLLNDHEPTVGRINANYQITRYYIPTPRQIRFSTTLDF